VTALNLFADVRFVQISEVQELGVSMTEIEHLMVRGERELLSLLPQFLYEDTVSTSAGQSSWVIILSLIIEQTIVLRVYDGSSLFSFLLSALLLNLGGILIFPFLSLPLP
jgi:hypothetical protein